MPTAVTARGQLSEEPLQQREREIQGGEQASRRRSVARRCARAIRYLAERGQRSQPPMRLGEHGQAEACAQQRSRGATDRGAVAEAHRQGAVPARRLATVR